MGFIKTLILQIVSKKLTAVIIGIVAIIGSHLLHVELSIEEVMAIVFMVCGQNVTQGVADVLKIIKKVADKTDPIKDNDGK